MVESWQRLQADKNKFLAWCNSTPTLKARTWQVRPNTYLTFHKLKPASYRYSAILLAKSEAKKEASYEHVRRQRRAPLSCQ